MGKIYKTTDGGQIRKIGRAKKIYFTTDGTPFFIWHGGRVAFDCVERLSYPVFYDTDDGRRDYIGGVYAISNTLAVLVQIDDGGESVQLWEELNA